MTRSATILIVEDDQSMLDGMKDLLQAPTTDIGYHVQVLVASNGQAGLEIMAEQQPDLIVSDVMMPTMDGLQFLREVRKNSTWVFIPFIFLTARGEKHEVDEGRLSGADLYITKPFRTDDLLELIKTQLDRSFQLQVSRQESIDGLLSVILKIINHEFRTPLTLVTAYYEMLADSLTQYSDNQNFQEYLRGIQAGYVRLTRLVEDFILVMEIRTGEAQAIIQQRKKSIENIGLVLQEAVRANQKLAKQQGVQIHYTPTENPPPVFGDPGSLFQVFDRLLDNAIKFTSIKKSDGNIYVSIRARGDEVHLLFEDEGVGFPQHITNQIFELFFQYGRELMEQQGAGTGLTIARKLVELHHGRIEVESEVEVGSKFTIVLPVYTGDPDQPAVLTSHDHSRQQATVLVVEDDRHLLAGLRELLEIFEGKYQLKVITAENGKMGMKILAENQPDLIISDIMMPEMDGFEFLQEVRQNPDWLRIPLIFLTARGEPRDIHRGRRSGAEEYITKPYDSDVLLGLVVTQLDRYFRMQDVLAQDFDAFKQNILNLMPRDLNMPLATVARYSEQLKNIRTDEELKNSLRGIQSGSIRLTRLVEDFISLAELKTGEAATVHALQAQPIHEIGFLLHEAGQMYTHTTKTEVVPIHCTPVSNLPPVFGNGNKLLDSFRRLIETGVQCDKGNKKEVFLSSSQVGNEVHLSVHCTAPLGENEAEMMATILTADDPVISELPDYGPGLSIVKGYVDLHNGRIELHNDENDGHTFTIILPVYDPTPDPVKV